MKYKSNNSNWVLFLWERIENSEELEAFEKQIEYSDEPLVEEYLVSSKIIELAGNKIEKFEIIEKQSELTYLSIDVDSNAKISISTDIECSVQVDPLKQYIKVVI